MTFLEHYHEHRDSYRAMLFDIDGTLARGRQAAAGAIELLAELRGRKFPYLILTNDANHSVEEKSEILAAGGLDVPPSEIVSGGAVLRELVELNGWEGKRFFVLGQLGTPCFAELAGLEVCRDESRIDDCFGIINAEGYYNWHDHIQAAINFFRRHPYAPFVVPNPDSYWPGSAPGVVGVGAGGQARFICQLLSEMGIEVNPIYLGKPYRPIYDYTMHLLRRRYPELAMLPYNKVLMLGDSLQSDIRGANQCGMVSGLLLTGITDLDEAARAVGECRPSLIFESIG